jgi:hypothetical protein
MIEVVPLGNGWTWQMIGLCGRVLVTAGRQFSCDGEAFDAAKAYRTEFWARASLIDHRMGACV